jgi:iron complex outermembrane receptor protein
MHRNRYPIGLLAGSAFALGLSTPALAQAAEKDADPANDIIVTARRVEERLQDVPISLTVFNQETLNKQNVFSARDLATYTPSLSANSRYGADFASFSIRGFTQEARTTASVGVYFADAVTPRSGGAASASGDGAAPGNMFDLENVQVLKGPQGTLFGRNTTGGAVILVPKRPTDQIEGYAEASYGNYDMRRLQAVLNLPASESLQFRGGVDWQKRDGYMKNLLSTGPRDFNDINYVAGRLSVLAKLSPDLENYTVFSYSDSNTNGAASKLTDCYNGTASLTCQQLIREQGKGNYASASWLPNQYQSSTVWQVANTLKWQAADNLVVKSVTSFGRVTLDQALDVQNVVIPLESTLTVGSSTVTIPDQFIGLNAGSSIAMSPAGLHTSDQTTFTQELQFQGKAFDNRLNWQAGAYFERSAPKGWGGTQSAEGVLCADEAQLNNFTCTDLTAATGTAIRTGYGQLLSTATAFGARNRLLGKVDYRNVGIYAQATFDLTPQLAVEAGFRYTWDRSWGEASQTNVSYSATSTPAWAVPAFACMDPSRTYAGTIESCAVSINKKSSAPTWLIGANFKPSDNVMLYLKYSRGYRQGAANPIAAVGFQTYEPEKVDVYEAGLKTSFHGAISGTFNVSAFYNDFSNMQLQVAFLDLLNGIPPQLTAMPAIVNVGKSRIYGTEVEASITPLRGLTLQASYAYLNTKLTNYTPPDLSTQPAGYYDFVSGGPTQGKRLQYTPEHKLTISANYRLPVDESIGKISLGVTYIYTGKVFYGDTSVAARTLSIFSPSDPNYDPTMGPGYNLVNLNINWDNIAGSGLSAAAFMTNATNTLYYEARSLSGSRGFINRYVGEPRMYGLRLRYSF